MRTYGVLSLCVSVLIHSGVAIAQDVAPLEAGSPAMRGEQPDDPYLPTPPQPPRRFIMGGGPVTRGPFVSYQVNVNASGNNIMGDAGNEPSIAINPTDPDNIVIGWRQFDNVNSNFRQAGRAYSFDGGQTWTNPGVFTPGVFRSDPVLGSDNDGNIYYYSLSVIQGSFECEMFKSADGGLNWIGPIPAFGGDKAWITVDNTGGVGEGNIYSAWSTAGNNYFPNQFTRSLDGGQTWPDLVEIPPEQPRWGTLTVDPTGDLYVCGTDGNDLWVAKSTNAKFAAQSPTFDFTVKVDLGGLLLAFEGETSPNPGGLLGQMWIASDHSGGPADGNIYALATVDAQGFDPEDVMFARSVDGGLTWSEAVRVNDDASFTNAWQWFGTMSVAPNGRIDAIWNDTRNTNQADLSELYYAYSLDAGETWSINVPASPVFDSHDGWPSQSKLGDYYHMISDNAAANLAYAATFNDEQDVYFLRLGDCNNDGVHDGEELADGSAFDVNANGILDECECSADLNADLNGDGNVNAADLAMLLGSWGPCAGCPADFNGDDQVDAFDLAQLLGHWGPC